MEQTVDGEYQVYKARDGAYVREKFFGANPKLLELVSHLTEFDGKPLVSVARGQLDLDALADEDEKEAAKKTEGEYAERGNSPAHSSHGGTPFR